MTTTATVGDGYVEIVGLTLDEIWTIAHEDSYEFEGRAYVPMLSFIEQGTVATPVLYLSDRFCDADAFGPAVASA